MARSTTYRMGHGVSAVTVPVDTPMGGYDDRVGGAAGVLDPIEMHAVVIGDGASRFVWVVADLPCVNTDLASDVRAAVVAAVPGASPATVWLSATHTHAGPETGCTPGGTRTPAPWGERLTRVALGAVTEAVDAEVGVDDLALHRTTLRGVGGQRSGRRPRRTVPLTVLVGWRAGRPHGVVAVLPVHPTVLGADNRLVSADLAGACRRAVADAPGAGAPDWTVVATGAAGDVSTRPHRREQTGAELARLGSAAARGVARAVRTPGVGTGRDGTVGRAAARTAVALPPRVATEVVAEPEPVAAHVSGAAARRTAYTRRQGARLAQLARDVREPRCTVTALTIGNLQLVGVGAEPFLDLDRELRDRAGPSTVLVGYTDGYLGYLPTDTARRDAEYEVLVSPCAHGAADAVLDECVRLLPRKDQPR